MSEMLSNYKKESISIICPSPKGFNLAMYLQKELDCLLYVKKSLGECVNGHLENKNNKIKIYAEEFKLSQITKEAFNISSKIIFISSTGIAVRAIAPFLKSKDKDPGVVVVDLSAKYAVSLVSGHLGGANEMALRVSKIISAEAIITTATDSMGIIGPDVIAKKYGYIIDDLKSAKYIASLLVDNKIIGIKDEYNEMQISKGYEKIEELREDSIWITNNHIYLKKEKLDCSKILKLIKRNLVLGIGCRRDTPYEKIIQFIENSLKYYNFDIRAVKEIVSVDIKKDEQGIIRTAKKINCSFRTFDRAEIKTVQHKYGKSEFVLKTLGVTAVCEPCVELAGAKVIINKIKHEGMTLCIGKIKAQSKK